MIKLSRRHINLLIVAAFVFTVLLVLVVGLLGRTGSSPATVKLGDQTFRANIAQSDLERVRGLSGVDGLGDDEALLFVSETDQMNRIWMKDMNFAIDVAWISSDFKIVHVEKSLQPSSYPKVYGPSTVTRYVVELPDGSVDAHSIKVGSYAQVNYKNGGTQ